MTAVVKINQFTVDDIDIIDLLLRVITILNVLHCLHYYKSKVSYTHIPHFNFIYRMS